MSTTAVNTGNARGAKDNQVGKRGGYSKLNINYKGGRGPDAKGHGKSAHGGMQSLGKVVATSRRMPNPASLPSLRSENSGNDPSVTLVPAGGGGWKGKEKDESPSGSATSLEQKDEKPPSQQPPKPPQKGPPQSPGRKFKSEFPSLGEQGSLSKRELEEKQKSHKDRGEGDKPGERGRAGEGHGGEGWTQGPGEKMWRDHPPPPHGLPMGPPPPGGYGSYPRPHYPPHPYMMHGPPARQGPPYPNVPPPRTGGGRGSGGRFPPPPMHYRPPYPPHPSFQQNPYEMPPDAYRMHHGEDDVSRPPTIKQDELKQLDVAEEDEGGWAGHHEEVDYTKEVVFSDSSDEEAEGKGKVKDKGAKSKDRPQTGPEPLVKRPKEHMDSNQPPQDKPSEYTRPHHRSHDRSKESHDKSTESHDRPHNRSHDRDRESHDTEGHPRHNMPPYPPYPPYPQYYHHGYPPMYPPGPPYPVPPQHGYSQPPHSRYPRRGNPDELNWRHEDEGMKRDDKPDDRPRILTKPRSSTDQEVESVLKGSEEKPLSLQRTVSTSSDTPKHVTFEEMSQSPTSDDQSSHAPARRAPQKRVMLRKLAPEQDVEGEKTDQQRDGNRRAHPKDAQAVRGEGNEEALTPDGEAKPRPMAWATERGTVGKLYEPEGKKSAAKFQKYQAQTQTRGRKDSRGSQGSTTPTAEVEGRAHTPDAKTKAELTSEGGTTRSKTPPESTEHQKPQEQTKPSPNQAEGRRSFPERSGPYREDHRDERPRHEQRRVDRPPPRDNKRIADHPRAGGHQKGREGPRTDTSFDKRRDNRRSEESKPVSHRSEDRAYSDQKRPNRRERGPRSGTPEKKTETVEHKKPDAESKPVSTETINQPTERNRQPPAVEGTSKPGPPRGDHEHREPRHGRPPRGERLGRKSPFEREDGRGERGNRHPRQGGRSDWSEDGEPKRHMSQELRRGPPRQPVKERDNHGPPPHGRKSHEEKPPTHKDTDKGRPAHGYSEVIDIESGSDWESEPPKEPDPNLSVPERARERQPLLPTPQMHKIALDQSKDHHQSREPKRHPRSRDAELEERRREPVTDLREKIRGSRGRGGPHDVQRRGGPDSGSRSDARKGLQTTDREAPRNTIPAGEAKKTTPVTSQDKVDAIPTLDSPPQQSKDFEKYDLNSHKVAIVDNIDASLEGRFSPSAQGGFTEVTSRKTKKENSKKEKEREEQRRQEAKIDEEKRKRKQPGKPADKAPPTDNRPVSAWSNTLWKDSSLPAAISAPGSQLNKPLTASSSSPGVIGQTATAKQAVPHTAELMPTTVSQAYSLFGPLMGAFPTNYPTPFESAIGMTIPDVSASKLASDEEQKTQPLEDGSKRTTTAEKDLQAASSSTDAKPKRETSDKTNSDTRKTDASKVNKNLPPRFKTQQAGSGRGRSRYRDGGGEKKERKVGRQGNGDHMEKTSQKDRGRAEPAKAKVPPASKPQPPGPAPQPSTGPPATGSDKDRFYIHPQRRSGGQDPKTQDTQDHTKPPSKVVPVEDHTSGPPPLVPVATGQQPLRAGSSLTVRPVRVSVEEERCETSRPTSSSSTHSLRVDNPKRGSRPTSAPQAPKMSVVTKSFSYAQALKSAGQSSTPTSSYISSRSETPPISPFCVPQDDKSIPSSPFSARSDSKGTSKPVSPLPEDECVQLSQMSGVVSVEEEIQLPVTGVSTPTVKVVDDVKSTNVDPKTTALSEKRVQEEIEVLVTQSVEMSNPEGVAKGVVSPHPPTSPGTVAVVEPVSVEHAQVEELPLSQVDSKPVVSMKQETELNASIKHSEITQSAPVTRDHTHPNSSLPVKVQSQLPTAHVLPMPHSTMSEQSPPTYATELPQHHRVTVPTPVYPAPRPFSAPHPHTSQYHTTVAPHHHATLPPHPHNIAPPQPHSGVPMLPLPQTIAMNPAIHTQQHLIPSHPSELPKHHPLMTTPTIIPEPGGFLGNPPLFGAPPGIGLPPRSVLPGPMRPIMSTKSYEQLEAIAKVREHMAVTNALEAQRKTKVPPGKTEMQSSPGQTSFVQSPRSSDVGLGEQASTIRPPEVYSTQQYPVPMGSVPNQGRFPMKQPPLLSQPPPTRQQTLIHVPGHHPAVEPFPAGPRLSQLPINSPQQLAAFKQAQAIHAYMQHRKMAESSAAAYHAMNQSGQPLPDHPVGAHPGYNIHPQKPLPRVSMQQPQPKSAFSPYPKSATESVRIEAPKAQAPTKPQPAVVNIPPKQELSQDEEKSDDENGEQNTESGKSGLSVTATPFVPSVPVSGESPTPIPPRSNEPVTTADRPLLPSPALYQPNLPLRVPQPGYPQPAQQVGVTSFVRQPQLPIPIPQQMISPALAAAAQQQRKLMAAGVPPSQILQTPEGQVLNPALAALHQQQMLERMKLLHQKQFGEAGSLSSAQLPPEMHHLGQRKGFYTPKAVELQVKHNTQRAVNLKSRMKHDLVGASPPQPNILPTSGNPRRAALLPTPSTVAAAALFLNAPRLPQTSQPWQGPPPHQVVRNPTSLLSLSAQDQLRVYSASMNAGPSGPQY